jgi:hypothetical protein
LFFSVGLTACKEKEETERIKIHTLNTGWLNQTENSFLPNDGEIINSEEKLEAYYLSNRHNFVLQTKQGGVFEAFIKRYDAVFFEKNILILLTAYSTSMSNEYKIHGIGVVNNQLKINLIEFNDSGIEGFMDAYKLILIELPIPETEYSSVISKITKQ